MSPGTSAPGTALKTPLLSLLTVHAIPQQGMPPGLGPESHCCALSSCGSGVAGTEDSSLLWQNCSLQTAPLLPSGGGLGSGGWVKPALALALCPHIGYRKVSLRVLCLYSSPSDVTWSVTLFSPRAP